MNVINFYDDMTEQQTTGNLKALAKRASLSGVQIAEQMGLRPETVSRHLNGKQNISIEDAMRYAKILGCTAEEILFQRSLCPIIGEMATTGIFTHYGQNESKINYLAGPISFQSFHGAYSCPGWFAKKKTAIAVIDTRPIDKRYIHNQTVGQISLNCIKNFQDGKDVTVLGYPFENSDFKTYTIRRIINMVDAVQERDRKKPVKYPLLDKDFLPDCELVWSVPVLMMIYDPGAMGFECVKDN